MPTSTTISPAAIVAKPGTVAQMLECSRAHVYQLIERGQLRRINVPGSRAVRVPLTDVYDLLGLPYPEDFPQN